MNVVDALVITLGLDATNFKKGQKETLESLKKTREASATHAKLTEEDAKKVTQGYTKVRDMLLSIGAAAAALVGGAKVLESLTRNDSATGRLAKNLGVGVRELSAWQGVIKRFGGTAGDMDSAFRGINQILEDLKNTGTSAALDPLIRAGLNMGKFRAETTTATERMKMLRDVMGKLTPQDAQYFGQAAGINESVITMLTEGGKALDEIYDRQVRLNSETEEDLELSNARTRAWRDLMDPLEQVARLIAGKLTPSIVEATKAFSQWLDTNREWMSSGIVDSIGAISSAVSDLWQIAGPILSLVGEGWKNIFSWVHAAADEVRSFKEVHNAAVARDGKDSNMLGRGVAHFMALFGLGPGDEARNSIDAERKRLGLGAFGTTPSTGQGTGLFAKLEADQGLPPGLLEAVRRQESGGSKTMLSPKGAQGPFQFMPGTARQYGLSNPYDLTASATAAARMFHDLLRQFGGNLPQALAAYNEGAGNVLKGNMFPETRNYVSSIMSSLDMANSGGARSLGGSGSSNSSSTDIRVNSVVVQTQATDAKGIARDLTQELKNLSLASRANYGLN